MTAHSAPGAPTSRAIDPTGSRRVQRRQGPRSASIVVAGLGSEFRRDDGAGPLVAARAVATAGAGRDIGPIGDPLELLGRWDDADLAVVIDAVRSGATPGTILLVELAVGPHDDGPVGRGPRLGPNATSTHGIGLAGALRLATTLGRAPAHVVVVGIEGGDFSRGSGLSDAVRGALPVAVETVVALINESLAPA